MLSNEVEEKSTLVSDIRSENTNLNNKIEHLQKELDKSKESITSCRIQIATMEAAMDKCENKSDWSTVESPQKPKPKQLL